MTNTPTPAMIQGLIEHAMHAQGHPEDYPAGKWFLGALESWGLRVETIPEVEYIKAPILGAAVFAAQHEGQGPSTAYQWNRITAHAQTMIDTLNAEGWTIARRT